MKKDGQIPRKFYIAHSVVTREHVKQLCFKLQAIGIITMNPFYNTDGTWKQERPEIRRIDEGKLDPYYIKNKSKANGIVEADLRLIEEADGLIALLQSPSVGTCLSMDTEVLTETGWKVFDNLSIGEKVLSLNLSTERMEYSPITEKVETIQTL